MFWFCIAMSLTFGVCSLGAYRETRGDPSVSAAIVLAVSQLWLMLAVFIRAVDGGV